MLAQGLNFATTRDGARLAYRRHGTAGKPRIVLIHSLALDGSVWDGVVARLKDKADLLVYDCRGHGASDRKAGDYTPRLFADDLAVLMDHVGWRDAVVAGCSMGGCVAQAFAGAYPERTQGLALIDTTAWYGEKAPAEWRQRAETARAKGLQSLAEFQTTRWFTDAFREANPDVLEKYIGIFVANDPDCYVASCIMLGDADLRSLMAGYKMPVSVIVGEEDYATPVAAAQALQQGITGATLKILKGRHITPVELPGDIADELQTLAARAYGKA
ncbi:alpha/beta fold hydrolase [Pseudorhodoplanes sinuspersici]|uniref:Lactone hydrolase n=1 Tax=Pseudorhodoplanes sinuspersici TaxID=1235591 RepID=A0A1W6ZRQ7_9HYPH|nr:alpha/beta hydrolase [Pseudorhodoplanes sinuspersici]ARQ00074.1 lactone hydrolase [Pseudorhodoplanes sinuspersici]RKE71116.1 3-oxoadipate enol-lactonase [Pseudorhodoplanes sinuspersici]